MKSAGGTRTRVRNLSIKLNETALQRASRQHRERMLAEQAREPSVTPEAMRHGDYHKAWSEVDGQRAQVMLNRGGSTIQRWLNAAPDEILGDSERAAIRYCQSLWTRLDCKGQSYLPADPNSDGMREHEALAELSAIKARVPLRYWTVYENICRFEHAASTRHAKVVVGFVASLIAMWRGL